MPQLYDYGGRTYDAGAGRFLNVAPRQTFGNPYHNPDLMGRVIKPGVDLTGPELTDDRSWLDKTIYNSVTWVTGQAEAAAEWASETWDATAGWVGDNIDSIQTGIAAAGMLPGVGLVADVANSVIYAARGQWDEAAFSLVSAVPLGGDAAAAANLTRKAVVTGAKHAAQNAVAQGTAMIVSRANGGDRQFSAGQVVGAGLTGGLAPTLGVAGGRAINASSRGLGYRVASLATGAGIAGGAGNAAQQYLDTGRVDLQQVAMSAAFSAAGAAVGQRGFDKTCFAAEMPMIAQTEEGWKRADRVQENDLLGSRDENDPNGPVVWKRVEEVFVAQGEIWEVRWAGQTIRTTGEHPFFAHGLGWIPASELQTGTLLATMDGRYLPVESIVSTGKIETVYNFRIADHHTYFVGKPEWGVALWAHNACVYESTDPKTNKVLYVGIADRGISSTLPQRASAAQKRVGHKGQPIPGTVGMTTKQVEAIEQALIAHHGRTRDAKNPGTLDNIYRGVNLSPQMLAYGVLPQTQAEFS